MKMDFEKLTRIVEERVPTARATYVPEAKQIVVTFTNRPGVEISLLTPWHQNNLNRGDMSYDDLEELLHSVRTLAAFSIEKKRPRRASSDLEL